MQGDGAGAGDPRRDPDGRGTGMLAWLATIVLVGVVIWLQAQGRNAPAPTVTAATTVEAPDPLIEVIGRYTVWGGRLMTDPKQREPLLTSFEGIASGPVGEFRAAIVAAELAGKDMGAVGGARLDVMEASATTEQESEVAPDAEATSETEGSEAGAAIPDELREDMATMRAIWRGDGASVTPEAMRELVERHGWFGSLGASFGKDDSDPERAAALAKASRTGVTLIIAAVGAGGLAILGFALGIVALAMWSKGKIRAAYAPPAPGGSVYLESFAVFLGAFLVIAVVSGWVHDQTGVDIEKIAIWALIVCPFWPLARGADARKHRFAIGLHAGAKKPGQSRIVRIAREMGAGLLGYVAGLPIFMLGILGTLLLLLLQSALASGGGEGGGPPAHPIVNEIGKGGVWGAIGLLALASGWAPLVEELMFRGCFYHHLRGRWRPLASGLVVALVFAAIHPPGIVAVPALMSLALVFSLIREWRGSIIGCMTAHAAHNGAVMTTLLIAMS